MACVQGNQLLVDFFIQKGFNLNSRDRFLKTPLHLACLGGFSSIVARLVKNGAQSHLKDRQGAIGFHYACASGSVQLIKDLLEINREYVNVLDNENRTGIIYTIWN